MLSIFGGYIKNCIIKLDFNWTLCVRCFLKIEAGLTPQHRFYIPSSALQRSMGGAASDEVLLVTTVIESIYFKVSEPRRSKSRAIMPTRIDGDVMGGFVLVVRAGSQSVTNLPHPVRLTFVHNKQVDAGTCVFWYESAHGNGTVYWSPDGCETNNTGSETICSCNHMSFFAVLVMLD
ncbi:adhesion G-protein coupled receptor G1-like isoform X1 [Labrus bergylta]|uniref:adhesion G-protein coupled receptor G1-like isoform X1 n=1 Tax=Labrus bergylta TaxID=56723 RepID=UPI0009B4094C